VFADPPRVAVAIMEVGSGVYHRTGATDIAASPQLRGADLASHSGVLIDDMVAQEK
jgi:hypothetical protein